MNRIDDYALIGDCHSAALIGTDGAVDWLCFPRFDSPSVFARALDAADGGTFVMAPDPEVIRAVSRRYLDDTNVLQTTFETRTGVLEVTDCMPVAGFDPGNPGAVRSHQAILRGVKCVSGTVAVRGRIAPRFEYGLFAPRFRVTNDHTAEIVGGADALWITASRPLKADGESIVCEWDLSEGDEGWVEAAWSSSHADEHHRHPDPSELPRRLQDTIGFWRAWLSRCAYVGEHAAVVRRSALVLKALTYAPTGAIVAAPTTSLPEHIGGERNWDYRFTWVRDATLALTSLFVLGYRAEADAFKLWLERTGAGRPEDLQIMYGIAGERRLPELELPHLRGHRDSPPVRIGNGAAGQTQLDSYGQILEASYLYAKAGGQFTPDNWRYLHGLVEICIERWRQPDHGIWEIRDAPRHFVHSKVHCWLALDRAVKLAERLGAPAPLPRWRTERDALRDYLMRDAAAHGWFPQAVGVETADASTLLVPAVGFLPTTHPLVLETIDVVRRRLSREGLVYRYLSDDGIEGGEGAFLLCSFWLLDCLTHAGRLDEAETLLARLLDLANDVGLYPEEHDPDIGEGLGNFPQAFTHMALVTSCAHLSAAKRGEIDYTAPNDYAELALDRLLAAGAAVTES